MQMSIRTEEKAEEWWEGQGSQKRYKMPEKVAALSKGLACDMSFKHD